LKGGRAAEVGVAGGQCGIFCFFNGTGNRTVYLEDQRCKLSDARDCMSGLSPAALSVIDQRFGRTKGMDHCNDGEFQGCQRGITCRSSGLGSASTLFPPLAKCGGSAPEPVKEPTCALSDPFFLSTNCTGNCTTTGLWPESSGGANLRPHFLLAMLLVAQLLLLLACNIASSFAQSGLFDFVEYTFL